MVLHLLLDIRKGKTDDYIALIALYDTVSGSPGSDDNAAAIGITLEVMKHLQDWKGNCNILVLFPDLEEPPNFFTDTMGSTYFFKHSPIPINKIRCSIVMDLVGHDLLIEKREDSLFVIGAESSGGLLLVVSDASKEVVDLQIYPVRNIVLGVDYSDYHVFALEQRPFLFLTSGMGPNYHAKEDTSENISPAKMLHISQFVVKLLYALDREPLERSKTIDQESILKAEAAGYKRFTEIDFINEDEEQLNSVGAALMEVVNCGSYITLEEVKELCFATIREIDIERLFSLPLKICLKH